MVALHRSDRLLATMLAAIFISISSAFLGVNAQDAATGCLNATSYWHGASGSSGACRCLPGWTGPRCHKLALPSSGLEVEGASRVGPGSVAADACTKRPPQPSDSWVTDESCPARTSTTSASAPLLTSLPRQGAVVCIKHVASSTFLSFSGQTEGPPTPVSTCAPILYVSVEADRGGFGSTRGCLYAVANATSPFRHVTSQLRLTHVPSRAFEARAPVLCRQQETYRIVMDNSTLSNGAVTLSVPKFANAGGQLALPDNGSNFIAEAVDASTNDAFEILSFTPSSPPPEPGPYCLRRPAPFAGKDRYLSAVTRNAKSTRITVGETEGFGCSHDLPWNVVTLVRPGSEEDLPTGAACRDVTRYFCLVGAPVLPPHGGSADEDNAAAGGMLAPTELEEGAEIVVEPATTPEFAPRCSGKRLWLWHTDGTIRHALRMDMTFDVTDRTSTSTTGMRTVLTRVSKSFALGIILVAPSPATCTAGELPPSVAAKARAAQVAPSSDMPQPPATAAAGTYQPSDLIVCVRHVTETSLFVAPGAFLGFERSCTEHALFRVVPDPGSAAVCLVNVISGKALTRDTTLGLDEVAISSCGTVRALTWHWGPRATAPSQSVRSVFDIVRKSVDYQEGSMKWRVCDPDLDECTIEYVTVLVAPVIAPPVAGTASGRNLCLRIDGMTNAAIRYPDRPTDVLFQHPFCSGRTVGTTLVPVPGKPCNTTSFCIYQHAQRRFVAMRSSGTYWFSDACSYDAGSAFTWSDVTAAGATLAHTPTAHAVKINSDGYLFGSSGTGSLVTLRPGDDAQEQQQQYCAMGSDLPDHRRTLAFADTIGQFVCLEDALSGSRLAWARNAGGTIRVTAELNTSLPCTLASAHVSGEATKGAVWLVDNAHGSRNSRARYRPVFGYDPVTRSLRTGFLGVPPPADSAPLEGRELAIVTRGGATDTEWLDNGIFGTTNSLLGGWLLVLDAAAGSARIKSGHLAGPTEIRAIPAEVEASTHIHPKEGESFCLRSPTNVEPTDVSYFTSVSATFGRQTCLVDDVFTARALDQRHSPCNESLFCMMVASPPSGGAPPSSRLLRSFRLGSMAVARVDDKLTCDAFSYTTFTWLGMTAVERSVHTSADRWWRWSHHMGFASTGASVLRDTAVALNIVRLLPEAVAVLQRAAAAGYLGRNERNDVCGVTWLSLANASRLAADVFPVPRQEGSPRSRYPILPQLHTTLMNKVMVASIHAAMQGTVFALVRALAPELVDDAPRLSPAARSNSEVGSSGSSRTGPSPLGWSFYTASKTVDVLGCRATSAGTATAGSTPVELFYSCVGHNCDRGNATPILLPSRGQQRCSWSALKNHFSDNVQTCGGSWSVMQCFMRSASFAIQSQQCLEAEGDVPLTPSPASSDNDGTCCACASTVERRHANRVLDTTSPLANGSLVIDLISIRKMDGGGLFPGLWVSGRYVTHDGTSSSAEGASVWATRYAELQVQVSPAWLGRGTAVPSDLDHQLQAAAAPPDAGLAPVGFIVRRWSGGDTSQRLGVFGAQAAIDYLARVRPSFNTSTLRAEDAVRWVLANATFNHASRLSDITGRGMLAWSEVLQRCGNTLYTTLLQLGQDVAEEDAQATPNVTRLDEFFDERVVERVVECSLGISALERASSDPDSLTDTCYRFAVDGEPRLCASKLKGMHDTISTQPGYENLLGSPLGLSNNERVTFSGRQGVSGELLLNPLYIVWVLLPGRTSDETPPVAPDGPKTRTPSATQTRRVPVDSSGNRSSTLPAVSPGRTPTLAVEEPPQSPAPPSPANNVTPTVVLTPPDRSSTLPEQHHSATSSNVGRGMPDGELAMRTPTRSASNDDSLRDGIVRVSNDPPMARIVPEEAVVGGTGVVLSAAVGASVVAGLPLASAARLPAVRAMGQAAGCVLRDDRAILEEGGLTIDRIEFPIQARLRIVSAAPVGDEGDATSTTMAPSAAAVEAVELASGSVVIALLLSAAPVAVLVALWQMAPDRPTTQQASRDDASGMAPPAGEEAGPRKRRTLRHLLSVAAFVFGSYFGPNVAALSTTIATNPVSREAFGTSVVALHWLALFLSAGLTAAFIAIAVVSEALAPQPVYPWRGEFERGSHVSPRRAAFLELFALGFDACSDFSRWATRLYFAVDVLCATALSLLASLPEAACRFVGPFCIACSGAYLAYVAILRPYASRVELLAMLANAILQLVASIAITAAVLSSNEVFVDVVGAVQLAQIALLIVLPVALLVQSCRGKERDGDTAGKPDAALPGVVPPSSSHEPLLSVPQPVGVAGVSRSSRDGAGDGSSRNEVDPNVVHNPLEGERHLARKQP